MRTSSAIVTALLATAAGLFGVGMLTASGLSWVDSGFAVLQYSDSDSIERAIGMTIGALGVGIWLGLYEEVFNRRHGIEASSREGS